MFLQTEKELRAYWQSHKGLRADCINDLCRRVSEIDPDEEMDWEVLILGWAISKGLSVSDAEDFASQISYEIALLYPREIQTDNVGFMYRKKIKIILI